MKEGKKTKRKAGNWHKGWKTQDTKISQWDRKDEKACVFSRRVKKEKKEGKKKHFIPFLGSLWEGMAPICPTLTFERNSDYRGERAWQRWAEREFATGVCGMAQMIGSRYNNEKSRVKITVCWEKGGDVAQQRQSVCCLFLDALTSPGSCCTPTPWGTWVQSTGLHASLQPTV